MKTNLDNLKWLGRMALILLLVSVADGLVGLFARKPLPWVAIIPALLPALTSVFVIFPMMKTGKLGSPNA